MSVGGLHDAGADARPSSWFPRTRPFPGTAPSSPSTTVSLPA